MKVGSFDLVAILDGSTRLPLVDVVTRDDALAWDCPEQPVGIDGTIAADIGAYLLRSDAHLILFDAGAGPASKHNPGGGLLPENLRRYGVVFDDVTDVVFTHLHYDHVGWATQQGKPAFANATYHVHAADWEYFVKGEQALPAAIRKLSPLEKQLEIFDTDGELLPGVWARHSPGHSPGSTAFLVENDSVRTWLLGDVAHVILELTDPAWRCLYDIDPIVGQRSRNRLMAEASERKDVVAAAHFPGLCFGRLALDAGRRTYRLL